MQLFPDRPRIVVSRILLLALGAFSVCACAHISPGWAVDYGRSAGQFKAADAPTKAAGYLHQRITVEGTVTRVEPASVKGRSKVWVSGKVLCDEHLGAVKVGDKKRFAGIVQSVDARHLVLRPSICTDEAFHAQ